MKPISPQTRYVLILFARTAGWLCVVLSLFAAFNWFTTERWVLGYEHLWWIAGIGIAGVIMLFVSWKQELPSPRPQFSVDRHTLAIVSGMSGVVLVISSVVDQFSVSFTRARCLVCGMWPTLVILTMISIGYFIVERKTSIRLAILPLGINLATIILAALIWKIGPSLELGFRWRLRGYTEVVRLVEQGQIQPDERGSAALPPQFEHLSAGGEIEIFRRGDLTSVLFYDSIGIMDGYSATVYRSDDTPPGKDGEEDCERAWRVNTNMANWFYCESD